MKGNLYLIYSNILVLFFMNIEKEKNKKKYMKIGRKYMWIYLVIYIYKCYIYRR